MKKNKAMRLASMLMILVLATTSVVSGTFAKYTTTASSNDSARVAKWGVTIAAEGSAFAKEYTTHDTNVVGTIAKSVISTDKVLAPGTSGNLTAVTISGTPEVAVKVTNDATVTLSDFWVLSDGTTFYCPVVITVVGTGYSTSVSGLDFTSKAAFEAAVKNAITAYEKVYAANTDLSTVSGTVDATDSLAISWSWAFEGNNANDTTLGNRAADGNPVTISVAVTTTVTQID